MTEATENCTPRLRFPEFRDDGEWKILKLGKLCSICTGKKDANEGSETGIYPFFTCAEKNIWSDNYSFDCEALLIAGNANVGLTKYYNGKFEAYQRTYVLTNFKNILVKYLYLFLKYTLQSSLRKLVQISAMQYIKLQMLKEYSIYFPLAEAEQQKIADCLSSLDELVEAHEQKYEALRQHKKGLMQCLFPAEGETTPRWRFPEFRDTGEWEKCEIGDIFTVTRGEVLAMAEVQAQPTNLFPYPVYSSQTKNNGLAGFYSKYLYEDAITWTTDGANAGDVNFRKGKFYCTNVCGVLLSNAGYANKCIAELINSITPKHVSYVGNPKLMNNVMKKIVILIPSLPEQQKIADCLSALDERIEAQEAKIAALREHKKGLMQQLFPSL